MSQYVICALYRFVELEDFRDLKQPLLSIMLKHNVRGTLLLAGEGINGTIAGTRESIDTVLGWLRSDSRLTSLEHKESLADSLPFKRTRVKLKKEIVTMGIEGIDPRRVVGSYVEPRDWNDLIIDPNVVLVDTRNDYETQIGRFRNALDPKTGSFRDFPDWVKSNLDPSKNKKVAMYCTGGIRCEKSTAYLKEAGFEEVYHLRGGILKYLENVPESESLWDGECFVFDERVAVNHALEPGKYDQCHACRRPLTKADKKHEDYVSGVSCHQCADQTTSLQKQRYKERARQIVLAKERGDVHVGGDAKTDAENRRKVKLRKKKAEQERVRFQTNKSV